MQSQDVWEKRLAFADLKLKFPMLNDKADEELLVDKERPAKKPDASYVTLAFIVVFICILRYLSLDESLSRGHTMILRRGRRYYFGLKNVLP